MRYEGREDLENEELIRQHLEKTYTSYFVKLTRERNEKKYLFDWAVTDNNSKITKFVEFKARKTIKHDDFPEGIVLSLQKYNKGVEYYNSNNIKFCLVYWFKDGLFKYTYDPDHKLSVKFFHEGENQEPTVLIPPKFWRKICPVSDFSKTKKQEAVAS